MALQGTISDFGLADIFQLIGIQRKTGTLHLKRENELVALKFLQGSIVEADTGANSMEDLLGAVLVRTSMVSEDQLAEALKTQKKTLQRLGHILVKMGAITEEDLVEALRVQSLQIIYRLFRWRDGSYRFDMAKDVDYDDLHFQPIESESILMEGARMVDEWPLIERRIHSEGMVLRKTEEALALSQEEEAAVIANAGDDFDFDLALGAESAEAEPVKPKKKKKPAVSPEEITVLKLVDGEHTVQEVNDLSPLGEFDTYRVLADLITRKLLEEVEVIHAKEQQRKAWVVLDGALAGLIVIVALLGAAVGIKALGSNGLSPWKLTAQQGTTDELRLFASMSRLERIEQALRISYLDRGRYPGDLADLADGGYMTASDLLDPWGRSYGYQLSPGGYQLFGFDAVGGRPAELAISYRFSALQQMLSESPESSR